MITIENDQLLKKIEAGDEDAIIEGLLSGSASVRISAIIYAMCYELKSKPVVIQLEKLSNDESTILGNRVSSFANAALDRFKILHYDGDDDLTIRLIKAQMSELIK